MRTDECKHLNVTLKGCERNGNVFCPDCNKEVSVEEVLNNIIEEIKYYTKIKEIKEIKNGST